MARMNSCINNLQQINGAKHQWALENHKLQTDIPTETDLKKIYLARGFPKCPDGGIYTIKSVGEDPTCSIKEHCLP